MKTIPDFYKSLKNSLKGSPAGQIGDSYEAALDTAVIDGEGIIPLKNDLGGTAFIKNVNDFLKVVMNEYQSGGGAVLSFGISPDDKNSNMERPHFDHGGLRLPNKNYYFKTDSSSKNMVKSILISNKISFI